MGRSMGKGSMGPATESHRPVGTPQKQRGDPRPCTLEEGQFVVTGSRRELSRANGRMGVVGKVDREKRRQEEV